MIIIFFKFGNLFIGIWGNNVLLVINILVLLFFNLFVIVFFINVLNNGLIIVLIFKIFNNVKYSLGVCDININILLFLLIFVCLDKIFVVLLDNCCIFL